MHNNITYTNWWIRQHIMAALCKCSTMQVCTLKMSQCLH